jgi:uncharacterized membrane-anchored protein
MRRAGELEDNHPMLDELTALAADVEAGAAASQFRFGASRAYEEIVEQRLQNQQLLKSMNARTMPAYGNPTRSMRPLPLFRARRGRFGLPSSG